MMEYLGKGHKLIHLLDNGGKLGGDVHLSPVVKGVPEHARLHLVRNLGV